MREIRQSGSMRGCRKRAVLVSRLRPTLQSPHPENVLLPILHLTGRSVQFPRRNPITKQNRKPL